MLKCTKCKMPVDDMSDGCKQCFEFKKKRLFLDADGENSIPGDINNMRRIARNLMNHLEHVYKVKFKGDHTQYDPELVKSMALASKTMGDIIKQLRSVQMDAKRQLLSMSSDERKTLLAKALAQMPEADRLRVLELSNEEDIRNKPVLSPFASSVDRKLQYD